MTPGFNEAPAPPPGTLFPLDSLRGHAPGVHRPHSCHVRAKQTASSCTLSTWGRFHSRFTSYNHHHPPPSSSLLSGESPLNSHCDLLCLCCCLSLARTPSRHQSPCLSYVVFVGGERDGAASAKELSGAKNVQRVTRTAARREDGCIGRCSHF